MKYSNWDENKAFYNLGICLLVLILTMIYFVWGVFRISISVLYIKFLFNNKFYAANEILSKNEDDKNDNDNNSNFG